MYHKVPGTHMREAVELGRRISKYVLVRTTGTNRDQDKKSV